MLPAILWPGCTEVEAEFQVVSLECGYGQRLLALNLTFTAVRRFLEGFNCARSSKETPIPRSLSKADTKQDNGGRISNQRQLWLEVFDNRCPGTTQDLCAS